MADAEFESYLREKREQRRRMEQPARKTSDPQRDKPRDDPRLAGQRKHRRNPADADRQDVNHGINQVHTDKGYSG